MALLKQGDSNSEGTTQTGRLKQWGYCSNRATQTVRALLKQGDSNSEGTTQTRLLKRWGHYSNTATQTVRALLKHGYSNGEGTTQTWLFKRWGHYSNTATQTVRVLVKQGDSSSEGTTQTQLLKHWEYWSNMHWHGQTFTDPRRRLFQTMTSTWMSTRQTVLRRRRSVLDTRSSRVWCTRRTATTTASRHSLSAWSADAATPHFTAGV